jgi:ABC-type glutathione transport system ATPase component
MSDQDSLVEVRNLKKIYNVSRKKKVTALDGVSCQLRPGTCLAIVGESGSGKSTLAKIVMGMEHADGGEVVLSGNKDTPYELQERTSKTFSSSSDGVSRPPTAL